MTKPIKTRVVHSESKSAWNVINDGLSGKYKIARVPYGVSGHDELDARERKEAFEHAQFISRAFNEEYKKTKA